MAAKKGKSTGMYSQMKGGMMLPTLKGSKKTPKGTRKSGGGKNKAGY